MDPKRIIFFGLIFITILIIGCSQQTLNKQPLDLQDKCSSDYTISCYANAGQKIIKLTEESIPCSNDDDCSLINIDHFCNPNFPNVLKCSGEIYYCGNDNTCKRCDDSCQKNKATETSGPPNN